MLTIEKRLLLNADVSLASAPISATAGAAEHRLGQGLCLSPGGCPKLVAARCGTVLRPASGHGSLGEGWDRGLNNQTAPCAAARAGSWAEEHPWEVPQAAQAQGWEGQMGGCASGVRQT